MPKVNDPSWVDPTNHWLNRGEKFGAVIILPDGRVHGTVRKRVDTTYASIIGRGGVTGIKNTDAPVGMQYVWNHSNLFQNSGAVSNPAAYGGYGGLGLSEEQVRVSARTIPLGSLEGNEFQEGIFAMPGDAPQYFWWLDERKKLYAKQNVIKRFDAGGYGSFITYQGNDPWYGEPGVRIPPTSEKFKSLLRSQANARTSCGYFNNGLSDLVGAGVTHYVSDPTYAYMYYRKKHAILVHTLAKGMVGGVESNPNSQPVVYFDWPFMEGLGIGALHVGHNFRRRTTAPPGIVETSPHPTIDYNWQVGQIFVMGYCLSNGYMTFTTGTMFSDNINTMPRLNETNQENAVSSRWFPDVAGTAAPIATPSYPDESSRGMDAGYHAAEWYKTCERTAGQPWQQTRYRFAGSEQWFDPATDGTEICNIAAGFDGPTGQRRGRPDAMHRVKGNALDFWGFDCSQGASKKDTIIVNPVGDRMFEVPLTGCRLSLYNETI